VSRPPFARVAHFLHLVANAGFATWFQGGRTDARARLVSHSHGISAPGCVHRRPSSLRGTHGSERCPDYFAGFAALLPTQIVPAYGATIRTHASTFAKSVNRVHDQAVSRSGRTVGPNPRSCEHRRSRTRIWSPPESRSPATPGSVVLALRSGRPERMTRSLGPEGKGVGASARGPGDPKRDQPVGRS